LKISRLSLHSLGSSDLTVASALCSASLLLFLSVFYCLLIIVSMGSFACFQKKKSKFASKNSCTGCEVNFVYTLLNYVAALSSTNDIILL